VAEAALRLRRLRAPLAVAGARLRSHPARGLLVVFGVSLATGLLVAVLGGSLIARDRAVQRAVAALPPSERSFRVDNFLLDRYAPADRAATRALASLSSVPPMRGTILHELRIGGELVQLAALDDLGRLVRLRSGRLPRSCRPERCEVVQIGNAGKPRVQEGDIHLVRVGIGTLPTQTLFGDSLVARPVSGEQGVVLLTAGHLAFDRVHAFDAYARDYAWVTPVAPSSVHVWRVGQILDAESRAQDQLAAVSGEFELSGPDRALFEARSAGRISAERMLLVGGEVSALLLGFAVLAAIGLRRGLADESRRLLQRGARRFQLWLFLGAEVASLTLAGALVGLSAGVVAVLVVADRAGLPGEALLGHSLGSSWGIALVPIAWVVATAAVLVAVRAPRGELHLRLIRPLDVAALGAAVAAGIGLARGGLSAQTLAAGGDRTLLLLLPLLVCFAGAVLVGRLVGPLTRLAERASRKGPMSLRLALLALARAPSRTVATAAFLAVSLGLALFAAAYRSTLDAGARDEAAFQVPLDFALGEDTHLVRPLEAAPLSRFQRLAPGVRAYPVLRQSADVPGPGAGVLSPTVLGVPAPAVAALHWRSDYSGLGLRELSRRLGKDGPATLRGLALPQRRLTLRLPVRITGIPLHFDLVVRDTTGDLEPVSLGDRGAGPWDLSASLPAASGPRQLVGLSFQVSSEALANFLHGEVEGAGGRVPTGSLVLGSLRADGRVLTAWHGWKALGGARIRAGRLSYRFGQTQTMFVRLPQPTDGRPLRVIASGDIARSATGGRLTLDFGGATVPALVVGVGRRFPDSESAGEGFVIADESRLSTALDSQLPGTGTPGELWLSVPAASATRVEEELGRPPFSSLSLASRRDIESSLAADPLARGIELTLAAAAIVALLLALVGIGVALVSELRDERGDLVDLESQGVSPETLRKQFRWRAALVVALGALAGIALGLLLSAVAVSLILVSGAATAPEPPLRFATPWVVAAAGLGAVLVLTAVLVEAATRAAFRSETPMRASWGLE
jgi:hypothetical protein